MQRPHRSNREPQSKCFAFISCLATAFYHRNSKKVMTAGGLSKYCLWKSRRVCNQHENWINNPASLWLTLLVFLHLNQGWNTYCSHNICGWKKSATKKLMSGKCEENRRQLYKSNRHGKPSSSKICVEEILLQHHPTSQDATDSTEVKNTSTWVGKVNRQNMWVGKE